MNDARSYEPVKRRRSPGPTRCWSDAAANAVAPTPAAIRNWRRSATSRRCGRFARSTMWTATAPISTAPSASCQASSRKPPSAASPPDAHTTPLTIVAATRASATVPARWRPIRRATRRSFQISRPPSARPAAPWRVKTHASDGAPANTVSAPERASTATSVASPQSVPRGVMARGKLVDRAPPVEAGSPGACAAACSGPGAPAAPAGDRLRLLPSGPDLVHGPTSRGTRAIDAGGRRADPGGRAPREGIRPR